MKCSGVRFNTRPARERLGKTLAEVANAAGVTPGAVSQWESGQTIPTADKIPAIAAALGCSIDELYGKEG